MRHYITSIGLCVCVCVYLCAHMCTHKHLYHFVHKEWEWYHVLTVKTCLFTVLKWSFLTLEDEVTVQS